MTRCGYLPHLRLPHSGCKPFSCLVLKVIHIDLNRFYDNKEFSDVKIICSNKEIAAHKVVVCSQSKVLRGICSAGFKESFPNTIDFSTEDQQLIEAMLLFLYRGDYPDIDAESKDDEPQTTETTGIEPNDGKETESQSNEDRSNEGTSTIPWFDDSSSNPSEVDEEAQARYGEAAQRRLLYHVSMYDMGDRFDIPALEDLAKNKHHEVPMPLLTQELLVPFLETVPLIYNTTHENNCRLRDIAPVHTKQRKDEINENAIVKAKFQEIVADTPQFASDLLLREWSRSRNCCEICDEESEKELEGLVLCPRCALYNGYEMTDSVSSGGDPYPYSDMRLVL